jgi:hypothetical protein
VGEMERHMAVPCEPGTGRRIRAAVPAIEVRD